MAMIDSELCRVGQRRAAQKRSERKQRIEKQAEILAAAKRAGCLDEALEALKHDARDGDQHEQQK